MEELSDTLVVPFCRAKTAEMVAFFWWQVYHNVAVDANLGALLHQTGLAIAQDRVVVPHEQHWSLEPTITRLPHKLQALIQVDRVLERSLRRTKTQGESIKPGKTQESVWRYKI